MNKSCFIILAFVLAVLGLTVPACAFAQAGPTVLDQNRPDRAPPTAAPAPTNAGSLGQAQGPASAVQPFVLKSVVIDGGTVTADRLKPAWAPFVGRTVAEGDLKALAQAVSQAYGHSDVALYTIVTPRQTFAGGVVYLRVIEGYVEDVTVTGPGAGRLVRAYAAKLKRNLPLKRSRLERYLSLMRDIPGVTIDVQVLRGSKPGAVILAITAKRKHVEGGLSLNTRGTAYLGQNQLRGDLWFDGIERQGDQTRLTVAAPTDVKLFQYYGVGQTIALGTEGANLALSAGYLRTRPSYSPIEGDADTWGAQISRPLLRGYQKNLYVTLDLDGVDSSNAAYGQELYTERVRTVRAALAYAQQTATSALSLGATASIGAPVFGAKSGIDGMSQTNFGKFNLTAKWSRAVGKSWVVRLDAAAQVSAARLPGSEQFTLGGDEFGRAFAATSVAGDQGAAVSAELAYRPQALPKPMSGSELFGFIDDGQVRFNARPQINLGAYSQTLSSAGFGVRVAAMSKGMVELQVADALSAPASVTQSRGWRVTFGFKSMFS